MSMTRQNYEAIAAALGRAVAVEAIEDSPQRAELCTGAAYRVALAVSMRGRPIVSLRTIAEHRAAERRARMIRRLVWAALVLGALGVLATPCYPLAGYAC
jgi:hypothetical protein